MKKILSFITIVFVVGTVGSTVDKISKPYIDEFLLRHCAKQTKAVVIDEKNTIANSFNHQLSYIYLFKINRKTYKNNPADSTLKVGDTIEVEYYKYDPSVNRPLRFKH